jgi:hypothetical protein
MASAALLRKQELIFQNHLIDSYKAQGGYAKKWASDLMVGNPDLICAFPGIGQHLVEVKHRPQFSPYDGNGWKNQLEPKQIYECKRHIEGGGAVLAGVIIGSVSALNSFLCFFDPREPVWTLREMLIAKYVPGQGYRLDGVLNNAKRRGVGGLG